MSWAPAYDTEIAKGLTARCNDRGRLVLVIQGDDGEPPREAELWPRDEDLLRGLLQERAR